jgi:tRNA(Ile)-lysidine synthase
VTQTLPEALAQFSPELPLAVAFSGGADSTALLLACHQKWPGQVGAIHIHHGLQTAADDFQSHCERVCARLKVPLAVRRVNAGPEPGQSPEDAARGARYRAFAELAVGGWPVWDVKYVARPKTLTLAQHADDQVETILLALGRGAGLPGLAAMPRQWLRDGIEFYRPLLGVSACDIRSWLALQRADFIEDPSNADQRFTRNQIRAQILPALQTVFPHVRDTFARSAAHAAQAQELLRELADDDLVRTGQASGDGLVIKQLRQLSRARQANVLRHWLTVRFATQASAAQLNELLDQLAACTTRGHKINIKLGEGFAVRQAEFLTWYNP